MMNRLGPASWREHETGSLFDASDVPTVKRAVCASTSVRASVLAFSDVEGLLRCWVRCRHHHPGGDNGSCDEDAPCSSPFAILPLAMVGSYGSGSFTASRSACLRSTSPTVFSTFLRRR